MKKSNALSVMATAVALSETSNEYAAEAAKQLAFYKHGMLENYIDVTSGTAYGTGRKNQRQYRKLVRQNPHLRKSKKYRGKN
jgi:hypothetical protein